MYCITCEHSYIVCMVSSEGRNINDYEMKTLMVLVAFQDVSLEHKHSEHVYIE